MIGVIIFAGTMLLLLGWAFFKMHEQKKCKHVEATGFPNSQKSHVIVVCDKCGLKRRLVLQDEIVGIFNFWNRKVKVTRVMNEEENHIKLKVERIDKK